MMGIKWDVFSFIAVNFTLALAAMLHDRCYTVKTRKTLEYKIVASIYIFVAVFLFLSAVMQ